MRENASNHCYSSRSRTDLSEEYMDASQTPEKIQAPQPHHRLEKLTVSQCDTLGAPTRRAWVQGHVVEKRPTDKTIIIDDGTGVLELIIDDHDDLEASVGDYFMALGIIVPLADRGSQKLQAHQVIKLTDPNRELLWWGEIMTNQLST
mmetsp:Transcript_43424/g.98141  ORF Transcript_43424/g.98141 Transcript_43424/m.98141 type:complete len:148 (-) Transcript_43424:269-712(-)